MFSDGLGGGVSSFRTAQMFSEVIDGYTIIETRYRCLCEPDRKTLLPPRGDLGGEQCYGFVRLKKLSTLIQHQRATLPKIQGSYYRVTPPLDVLQEIQKLILFSSFVDSIIYLVIYLTFYYLLNFIFFL